MKLGFACKFIYPDGTQPYPGRTVTASRLSLLGETQQVDKLIEIASSNLDALYATLKLIGHLHPDRRMMRITSDLFPLFTHTKFSEVSSNIVLPELAHKLESIGELARLKGIRLSFHPGQFTVLASDRPDVVVNAIADMEYHTLLATHMGYGKRFQDFKINIHLSGKDGERGFRTTFGKLTPECRNMITVENDEVTSSVEQCLALADLCPIVLDIHHHWVMTNEYIKPRDKRVQKVIDSWRGVRPTMHYSVSKAEFVPSDVLPDQNSLGLSKMKLRAHSDYYHNNRVNDWAMRFTEFDIMCESKAKNQASTELYTKYLSSNRAK